MSAKLPARQPRPAADVRHRTLLEYRQRRREDPQERTRRLQDEEDQSLYLDLDDWVERWEWPGHYSEMAWRVASDLADILRVPESAGRLAGRWPAHVHPATAPPRWSDPAGMEPADPTPAVLSWARSLQGDWTRSARQLARDESERRAALQLLPGPDTMSRFVWVVAVLTYPLWVRPLSTWRRSSAIGPLEHVLGRYPVAGAVQTWLRHSRATLPLVWYVARAQGASLTRVTRGLGWPPVTPAMITAVEDGLTDCDIEPYRMNQDATLAAAVAAGGGSSVEFERLRFSGVSALCDIDRRFAAQAARWLVKHREALGDQEAEGIASWAYHLELESRRMGTAPFAWRGRTPAAALRAARAFEAQRNLAWSGQVVAWQARGWDAEVRLPAQRSAPYRVRELVTSRELAEEGAAQRHCVGSYTLQCLRGEAAIFQVGHEGRRQATVEVSPGLRRVVQARGARNAALGPEVEQVVRLWSAELGLSWNRP